MKSTISLAQLRTFTKYNLIISNSDDEPEKHEVQIMTQPSGQNNHKFGTARTGDSVVEALFNCYGAILLEAISGQDKISKWSLLPDYKFSGAKGLVKIHMRFKDDKSDKEKVVRAAGSGKDLESACMDALETFFRRILKDGYPFSKELPLQ